MRHLVVVNNVVVCWLVAHIHADKGIKTNYLPTSTVMIKAVEMPQVTKADGRVSGKFTGEYNYNFS